MCVSVYMHTGSINKFICRNGYEMNFDQKFSLYNTWYVLVWFCLFRFDLVLLHINRYRLFNAKSSLFIYILNIFDLYT